MPGDDDQRGNQAGPGTWRRSSLDQTTGRDQAQGTERRCPRCGGGAFYALADGRLMCRACRARFTPHKQAGHLDQATRARLTSLFWQMVPAARAAVRVGLNRKTVQRHYRLLRQGLSDLARDLVQTPEADWRMAVYFYASWPAKAGGVRGDVPLFGLARRSGSVLVVMVPGRHDWRGLVTDSVHGVALTGGPAAEGTDDLETAETFWEFARDRLGRYQGGWKANLPLFLHEMAFRFNWRGRVDPPEPLLDLI